MGTKIKAPDGYRLLKKGETIPKDYMWWDHTTKSWVRGFGLDTGRKEGFTPAGRWQTVSPCSAYRTQDPQAPHLGASYHGNRPQSD